MDSLLEERVDRRRFLKLLGTGMGIFALEGLLTKASCEVSLRPGTKRRYAMVIDLRRCIGCGSCTIACKVENNTPVDYSDKAGRKIFWNEVIFKEGRRYPYPEIDSFPRPCFHCERPACV